MDGNMKNRRDVCYAKDAGYIQFKGLTGCIKTGCAATPDFKSRYCSKHVNQACTLLHTEEVDEEMDVQTGPTLRSHHPRKCDGESIAEMILAKKTTRKQTYYQVKVVFGRVSCIFCHKYLLGIYYNTCAGFSVCLQTLPYSFKCCSLIRTSVCESHWCDIL